MKENKHIAVVEDGAQDEDIRENGETEQAEQEARRAPTLQDDPEGVMRKLSRGRLVLSAPINTNGHKVDALDYDFMALTGWEVADALDVGQRSNAFRISNMQALSLFAAAAEKAGDDVDAKDVKDQLGAADAAWAIQQAAAFFLSSTTAAERRSTKKS